MSLPVDPIMPPVIHMAARCAAGEIDFATACRLAAQPAFAAGLTREQVSLMCITVRSQSPMGNDDVAMLVAELLVIALAARGNDAHTLALRDSPELTWVRVVATSLGRRPDWRRFASARAAALA